MKSNTASTIRISATIHKNNGLQNSILPFIIKPLIVLCGCFGSVYSFLSCIDANAPAASIFITVTLCILFSLIFSLKSKYIISCVTAISAVLIFFTYTARQDICAGFFNILNCYMSKIDFSYIDKPFIAIANPDTVVQNTKTFLIWKFVIISLASSYLAVYKLSTAGFFIITSVPLFSVLMFGLEPQPAAFSAIVISWVSMLSIEISASGKISSERFKRYSFYCGMTAMVISIFCFAIIFLSMKIFNYERPDKLNKIYNIAVDYIHGGSVDKAINDFVASVTRNVTPSGAINHGHLGKFDEISFDGHTVLEVTIPKATDTIYLRGFVGSVYTGDSWEQLSPSSYSKLKTIIDEFETDGLSPLLFDSYNLKYTPSSMPNYSFTVKNIDANNTCLYMPYNLIPESISRYEIINDSMFTGQSDTYIGQFYDAGNYYGYRNLFRKRWSIPSALVRDEAAYRYFVYENYLDIPDEFLSEMILNESYHSYITKEEIQTGKSSLDEMTVFSRKLYYIKCWLRDNCEYSLSAGKLPSGKDFVNHFLETRKGSCSHFASAAVIMCRYAGIPARYVEGYIIKPSDFPDDTEIGTTAHVEIPDTRGHAWVEVYIDGFGWYPMEFTSGYGNVRTAVSTSPAAANTPASDSAIGDNTPLNSQTNPSTSTQTQENSVSQTAISETTEQLQVTALPYESEEIDIHTEITHNSEYFSESNSHNAKNDKKTDMFNLIWFVLLVIAGVPTIFILRRKIIISIRQNKANANLNDDVMVEYSRFKKILGIMKMPEQNDMNYNDYAKVLSEYSPIFTEETAYLIINTALKASFGGNLLTLNEANEMRQAVDNIAKQYYNSLTPFKRLCFKYTFCII